MGLSRARFVFPRAKDLRENAGLTIKEVCDLTGVSRDFVSRIEGGGRATRAKVMKLFNLYKKRDPSITAAEEVLEKN